ncbi:hypothetical protein HOT81_gp134 [Gordonia phage Fryberger]|uniref:Uncharacterized protein n=2 Tax=Ronaldovirus TaxID=2733205 RepID=A0A6B9L8G0_9CAUD|nr:hypothetical protein HOT81_gp134 [Gordonia phage Fryberger]AXN53549.1 hypothetical protein SEA_FRYBERGER_136 [Gordonia phage Fryberger]QHB38252.1 hypothetical protein SEA_VOLT_141 [Gordonia phage Volt]
MSTNTFEIIVFLHEDMPMYEVEPFAYEEMSKALQDKGFDDFENFRLDEVDDAYAYGKRIPNMLSYRFRAEVEKPLKQVRAQRITEEDSDW